MLTSLQKFGQGTVRFLLLLLVLSLWIPTSTVFSQTTPTDLFISEYIEGSSNNKAIEIFNGTGAAVNLSTGGYSVQMFFNGSQSAGLTINLTGTIANGDVYVLAQSLANATILAQADQTNGSGWFNGDDAIALRKGTNIIDSIGVVGIDPGTEWGTGLTSTADNTLVRKALICVGDSDTGNAFDPAVEWNGFATDTVSNLGTHTADFSNCPEPPPPPEPQLVKIHDVQGTGTSVVNPGTPIKVEAIVTADFSANNQLDGFYIQEEDADADTNSQTSEGIFVFCGSDNCGSFPSVNVGDAIRVTGTPGEFSGQSQINAATGNIEILSSNNTLPTPASVDLPVVGNLAAFYEPFEGMLVSFVDTLTVSEYFELFRFGEVVLYEGGRPYQYTHVDESPTQAEYNAHLAQLASRRIVLADDNNSQNSSLPDGVLYYPQPDGFSTENYFRGGDTVANLTGILTFAFGDYTILPTEAYTSVFNPVNTRPEAPVSTGSLTVASFNVLNYFQTIDTTASNDVGICGSSQTLDCRGADSAAEFEQQTEKLVKALLGLNADIYGLIELENTPGVEPLAYLVGELNTIAGAGTYAYVDTGVIGSDAIRVGIIYDTTVVAPIGQWQALTAQAFVNPFNADIDRNRPALAQSFREEATGAVFTFVVNHLKSKGSGCGTGDDSPFQGNCNGTRTAAAEVLVDWLATDPTGVSDSDYLLVGDYNSYANEDPIKALAAGGFVDLNGLLGGSEAYSYVFDGQLGYLDYALSSTTLTAQVADIAEWHINADEVLIFDYNDYNRDAGEASFEAEPTGNNLTEDGPYRTSDHDPVFVGLNLTAPSLTLGEFTTDEGAAVELEAVAENFNGDVTYSWDLDDDGIFEATGNPVWTTPDDGLAELPIAVQACDALGYCLTAESTLFVENVAPSLTLYTVPQEPLFQGETVRVLFAVTDPSTADTNAGFTISATCTTETALADELGCFVPTNTTNWSITGTAVDKDGGEGSATLPDIEVLNTSSAINYVISIVQNTTGLNAGQKNSLISKLLNIQQNLSNDNRALNQLAAFRNQVVDLQATGVLSADNVNILLTLAERLEQSIRNS